VPRCPGLKQHRPFYRSGMAMEMSVAEKVSFSIKLSHILFKKLIFIAIGIPTDFRG